MSISSRLIVQITVHVKDINEFCEAKEEGREFIKFHYKVIQTSHEIGIYQYKLLKEARKYLTLKSVKWEDHNIESECKKCILLPIRLHK